MKINYNKSKIYKITDNENGLYFIDRTTDSYLSKRIIFLKKSYEKYLKDNKIKYQSYFKIFENDKYNISLIEYCNCEDIKQLKQRVQEIINLEENMNELCLNHSVNNTKRTISKVKCQICGINVALNQKIRHENGKFHNSFIVSTKPLEIKVV